MPRPPKGSAKAANAAANTAKASLANTTDGHQPVARGGGQSTRGAKRRRTSANVNSAASDIYGTGTIVATNPFDDDHQPPPPTHHIQHLPPQHPHLQQQHMHLQQQQQLPPPMPNSANQMPIKMMPIPSQMHPMHQMHQQQPPNHHHYQQQQLNPQMHHQHQPYLPPPPPQHHQQHHHHQGPPPPQQQQMHPQQPLPPNHHPHQHMYSPNHQMQPMQVPQQSHMSATPPGAPMPDHLAGPPPPPSQQPMSHPQMHPHQHPQQHQGGFGPQVHATQMIGTSTPPHMMGPAPSHSPYMNQPQHGGPMMVPPHQSMTPQPSQAPTPQQQQPQQQQPQPHLEQMLMQQPYQSGIIYCGKCQREIQQHEQNIICKAGCRACFHISCSGLTPLACDLLMKESLAEWACDRCRQRVPPIKYKT